MDKHQDLASEIKRLWEWEVEARVIVIVIGALGTIHGEEHENIKNKDKSRIDSESRTPSLLGTARILRKVLEHDIRQ